MLDKQDLEAIGQMLDEKLKAELQPIKDDLKEIKVSMTAVIEWIDEAEHEVEIRFPIKRKAN